MTRATPKSSHNRPKTRFRTDPLHLDGFGLAGGVRVDHRQSLAEAQTRTQEGVQLAAGLEGVQAPEGA